MFKLKFLKPYWPGIVLVLSVIGFFYPIFQGRLPIPADTLLGMYHPWRDQHFQGFANFPFKNFLITDPIRQTYVYKQLAIELWRQGKLPLWNPYILAGTPLAASIQAGGFYPLNFIFLSLPFKTAWSIFIILQPVLASLFMWLYLRHLKIKSWGAVLVSLSWALAGFMMSWLTWGNVGHTALWLPLILLSLEKGWWLVLVAGWTSSVLAGHSQTAFYVSMFTILYIINYFFVKKINSKKIIWLGLSCLTILLLISPQLGLSGQLFQLSNRGADLYLKGQLGWFLPGFHLIQLVVPDFFGNPATQNYWGVWNYAEMVSYGGILGLLLAIYGLLWTKNKLKKFFIVGLILSLVLATDNFISRLSLNLPIIGSFQPTRLIFIFDFCLLVLAGFGWQSLIDSIKSKVSLRRLLVASLGLWLLLGVVWLASLNPWWLSPDLGLEINLGISQRNLLLPSALAIVFPLILGFRLKFKDWRLSKWFVGAGLLILVLFDLGRFMHKFTPFIDQNLVFPQVDILDSVKNLIGGYPWRVSGIDYLANQKRIMPPNVNMAYRLAGVDGYEPLYLKRMGEYVALMEWGQADLDQLSFNRSLIPNNFQSPLFDLLGIKYVLSLKDYDDNPKLKLIGQQGETRLYENLQAFERAFLVYDYRLADDKPAAAEMLLDPDIDLGKTVILEQAPGLELTPADQFELELVSYEADRVELKLATDQAGILVLTDSWYPSWRAYIDDQEVDILVADYAFRGVVIPVGEHQVVFQNRLF